MNRLSTMIVALILAVFLPAWLESSPQQQSSPKSRVIFAVWPGQKGKQPDAPILDPVVWLEGSSFKEPMKYDYDKPKEAEALYDAFVKSHFKLGQKYVLFFGGSDKGWIEVQKAEVISCESLTATIKTPVLIPNGQKALAAASAQGLALHLNWRQPATESQRAEFLRSAAEFFGQHGVANVSPASIKLENLRSTKLGAGTADTLIGSVTFKEKAAIHNLFLVTQQKGEGWEVAVSSYHVTKDVVEGTDNVNENFLDQLDLDSDGVDEIFTISGYYESWDYAIYKQRAGKWEQVYHGAGGGC